MKNILLIFLLLLAPGFFLHAQEKQKGTSLKPVYQNGRWGYADTSGKIVVEARFDAALPFSGGLARVGVVDEELQEIDARPNLLWGYIDDSGCVVVPLRYNALRGFTEGLAACAVLDPELAQQSVFIRRGTNNFRWGYVDRNGRVVIPTQYFAAGDFSEGLAPVNVGGKRDTSCGPPYNYGYIDKTGAFIIKPRFAHAAAFQNGRARVSIGDVKYEGRCLCCAPRFLGKHGFVDRNGNFVVDGTANGDDSFLDPDGEEERQ